MIEVREFTYPSADRVTQIHAMQWIPDQKCTGILQIVHGMQEFIERYDAFARYLCSCGIMVVGNDHLGHGSSVRSDEYYGYFADKNPNRVVLSDIRYLHRQIQEANPNVPYLMLGHSMGSFLVRQYLCMHGSRLDGAIIMGTGWHSKEETALGKALCSLIAKRKGWMYRSPMITKMAMGSYNNRFEPARTKFDWLTRDEDIVDAYRHDKRTQFTFTLNGYYMLFTSLHYLTQSVNLRRMPKDLPVLFISGEMDPVGNFGLGVRSAMASFRTMGMRNVECILYPNDRHEVLNELNRQEVYEDIFDWMEKNVPGRKA